MDRKIVEDHLKQAEEHVALGERHIKRQREIVAELHGHGHNTEESRRLLQQFEEIQTLHVEGRDRLRRMIEEMGPPLAPSEE
jgi:propanediol utilization protein